MRRTNKKGIAMLSTIVLFIIMIAIGILVFVVFRGSFARAGSEFTEEASEKAQIAFNTMRLKILNKVVGSDECNEGSGQSFRSTGDPCDINNDRSGATSIRDCCCCDVEKHRFDLGKLYAYKEVTFKFVPNTTVNTITVTAAYSKYANSGYNSFSCERIINLNTDPIEILDTANRRGYTLSCYIANKDNVEEAQFRYLELETSDGSLDYAKVEIRPTIRICKLDPTDDLMPGEGYWVYLATTGEEEVTISEPGYGAPIAIIDVDPPSALTSQDIHFDGRDSFSQNFSCAIVAYDWDWDGNDADGFDFNNPDTTASNFNHNYPVEGNYKVGLRVEDCNGNYGVTYAWVKIIDQYPSSQFDIYYEGFYSESIAPP